MCFDISFFVYLIKDFNSQMTKDKQEEQAIKKQIACYISANVCEIVFAYRNNKCAAVTKIQAFKFKDNVQVGDVNVRFQGDMFKTAKLTRTSDGGSVLVRLKDGGTIPKSFGVTSNDTGLIKVILNLSDNEYACLKRVHDDMVKLVVSRRQDFFPKATMNDEFMKDMGLATLQAPKRKREGDSYWSGSITVLIDKEENVRADPQGHRKCKVKSKAGFVDNIFDISGSCWERAVIEFRCIYIRSISFGLSKKLRLLKVGVPHEDLEIATQRIRRRTAK